MSVAQLIVNKISDAVASACQSVRVTTKILSLQSISKNTDDEKLTVSTNFLNIHDFFEGDQIEETVIGPSQGLRIKKDANGSKKVYGRNYKSRKRETLMDIRSQKKIKDAFGGAKRVHITMRFREVIILPICELTEKAINKGVVFNSEEKDGVFVGVLNALRIIKENGFAEITMDMDAKFIDSDECMLFSLQLRRMGYELTTKGDKLVAMLAGANATSTTRINLDAPEHQVKPKPLEFNYDETFSTFAVCSSGVDVSVIEQDGFHATSILDFRPFESRDLGTQTCKETGKTSTFVKKDKRESGITCAGVNAKAPRVLLNEDIYYFDANRNKADIGHNNFFHMSLQCSDFSSVKNKADKEKAIKDMSSTVDMFFHALDAIEKLNPATLLIENVAKFKNHKACALFVYQLQQLGYQVTVENLDAKNYNCFTSRNRCYVFGTKLNTTVTFEFPQAVERTKHIWKDIVAPNLDMFRDVTHTKGIETMLEGMELKSLKQAGVILTRAQELKVRKYESANIVTSNSEYAGAVIKSQNKQVAETLYIEHDNKFWMPDNCIVKKILGVGDYFDISLFNKEIGCEILGQSISAPLHKSISDNIKAHINSFIRMPTNRMSQLLGTTPDYAFHKL